MNLAEIERNVEELDLSVGFADARMDIWFEMGDGKYKDANEWFDVPLPLINEAIELLSSETLPNYRFDAGGQLILLRE